jgi:predicted kinase
VSTPTLVVVSGPPGSGKTRLAHALAPLVPCPAICRDEIKEGMVHAEGTGYEAEAGDALTRRTLDVFFDVIRLLLEAEATVVAEAAFQDRLWRHGLEPLSKLAQVRIVRCRVDAAVAWDRAAQRGSARPAHAVGAHLSDLEAWREYFDGFEHLSLEAPSIVVDTSDGYSPGISEIVDFVNAR